MEKTKYYIGIDPGVHTGLAIWDADGREFVRVETLGIVAAMVGIVEFLRCRGAEDDCTLIIEDARQRKWIPQEKSLSQFKGRAMGAGSVRRDCAIWEEFAKHYGLALQMLPPRKGLTKWSAEQFELVCGWTGRTSDHARDAAMLVFGK